MSETSTPPADASDTIDPGTVVDRYEIESKLREGGMASVYIGSHVNTGARVAIKVLHREYAEHEDIVARFDREAKVMGRLSGTLNIVHVHEVGVLDDGRKYLAMEFVRGIDLDDLVNELRSSEELIDIQRALRLLRDVARALEVAHRNKVVHRDLKPANVMIAQRRDGAETAKVLDFGVSADLGEKGQQQALTGVGTVIGTPAYMAPEQAAGIAATPSFDIYAFGVVAFELLTNKPPPPKGWRDGPLPPVESIRKGVPKDLAVLVRDCLDPDATKRIQNASELVRRLGRLIEVGENPAQRLRKWADGRPDAIAGSMASGDPEITPPPQPLVIVDGPATSIPTKDRARLTRGEAPKRRPPWVAIGVAAVLALGVAAWLARDRTGRRGAVSPSTLATGAAATSATTTAVPNEPTIDGAHEPPAPANDETEGAATPTEAGEADDGGPEPDAPAAPDTDKGAASTPDEPREAATAGGETPKLSSKSPVCAAHRHDAAAARTTRRWSAVLEHTKEAACWTSDRARRRALMAEAFLELEQYDRCIDAASKSDDPKVVRMRTFCEKKRSP